MTPEETTTDQDFASASLESLHSETLTDKPKLLIVYGQHNRDEEIAKQIAKRLLKSAVKVRTQLTSFEQPTGLD